jgi:hypothetical protein
MGHLIGWGAVSLGALFALATAWLNLGGEQ